MKQYTLTALSIALTLVFSPGLANADAQRPGSAEPMILEDFADDEVADRWVTVNDGVMGGKSTGGPSFEDGIVTFAGKTNTDGGGFSSIRSKPAEFDLAEQAGLYLRVKGDGRTYKASVRTDVTFRRWSVPFRADFETVKDEWIEVFIPFESFTPSFRGRELDPAPELDPSKVQSLGLMIYDKKDGPFELQVDWIKAVPTKPQPAPEQQ
ncbi:MAG: CIA30 family protein [Planctomycetota bacterium]